MLCHVAEGDGRRVVLTHPPDQVRVAEVLRLNCNYVDLDDHANQNEVARTVHQVLIDSEAGIENLTLADIIPQ